MSQTNKEFLESKLNNFKAFLRQHSAKPDTVDEMDSYTVDHFLVFGAVNLMPLDAAGTMNVAVEKTVERYHITGGTEVATKIGRYYDFLVAFLKETKASAS